MHVSFTTNDLGWVRIIDWVDHPFLQAIADLKDNSFLIAERGRFRFITEQVAVTFAVYDSQTIYLDYITTTPENRGKGYGKKTMQLLTQISDKTGIGILLFTANMKENVPVPKIPFHKLPQFYRKFGFVTTQKNGGEHTMEYTPKN